MQNIDIKLITVRKNRLIETLRRNKEEHKQQYEKALKEYKKVKLKRLSQLSAILESEKAKPESELIREAWYLFSGLDKPVSHEKQYEDALDLLDWETDEELDLTAADFKRFVQDDWEWKYNFSNTVNSYLVK